MMMVRVLYKLLKFNEQSCVNLLVDEVLDRPCSYHRSANEMIV